MAIFADLELEKIIQINDKTRLNATKSFVSKDEAAITLVEIEPEATEGFIDVTGTTSSDFFLDWQYTGATRTVTATTKITTDGAPTSFTNTIEVVTASDDRLFSADNDLLPLESDILRWVPDGRNSFFNVHREAQELIIAWLDEQGYVDVDKNPLTKVDIIDLEEVRKWSTNLTLKLIFQAIKNSVDDVFAEKAETYEGQEVFHRNRSIIRLDLNNDGIVDDNEGLNFKTFDLVRI